MSKLPLKSGFRISQAQQRGHGDGEQDEDRGRAPAEPVAPHREPARDHCSTLPKRPQGRMTRTATMTMNTKASAYWLVYWLKSPKEITSPTIRAPTSDPTMLPRPPITLIAKARTRMSVSMDPPMARLGATIAPPRAASPAPIAKTVVYRRATL